jgi:hypothetical protein
VKADPRSAQIEVETYAWNVLPEHLKTGSIVDSAVSELERAKSQLHHAEAPKWT